MRKLVREVDQITFSGAQALKRGQEVWYSPSAPSSA